VGTLALWGTLAPKGDLCVTFHPNIVKNSLLKSYDFAEGPAMPLGGLRLIIGPCLHTIRCFAHVQKFTNGLFTFVLVAF
jgi:hypothetical protein